MHGLLVSVGASKRRRKKARGWWISQSELDVVGKDQCDTINACICVFSCADTCSRSVSVESTVRTPQLEQLANCNTHSETLFHAAPATRDLQLALLLRSYDTDEGKARTAAARCGP